MKARDIVSLHYRIHAALSASSGRWEGLLAELRVANSALSDPASLLTDAELINAALTHETCPSEVLEQLTDEALLGELARRGKWLLDTTPPPTTDGRLNTYDTEVK